MTLEGLTIDAMPEAQRDLIANAVAEYLADRYGPRFGAAARDWREQDPTDNGWQDGARLVVALDDAGAVLWDADLRAVIGSARLSLAAV